ncbi:serine/threonine protein kinase [Amycolatopsis umgeniensis]|uniref:mitogen-activated protein kinase kinase n=1 Tax=Amycolatopsis umgeniensis TaxID=336628 RepID=A0A841AYC0_9PSEU|nr:protein kinase [Amycolatopsis umgeniensis]MBB5851274.1 serine/threonine protein kinase [Amycolatopsis umgeniensis]
MSGAGEKGPTATVVAGPGDSVLKVYPVPLDRETRSALAREQALLSTVSHVPEILPVQEVGTLTDGRTTLRMPRCDRSLATVTGPLPVEETLRIGRVVARALAAAHTAGVVHGSITPRNVLFLPSGEPVLADFGVALRQRFRRDPLYDLEFTAPETVRDQTMDERADRYGLGAVLHFMLTGEPPHRTVVGEQPAARLHRVLTEPVPPITRADVPAELVTLVGELLAAEPGRRPEDTQSPLFGLPAEPVLVLEPARTPRPRRRYGLAAGILAGAGVLAAVSWFLATRDDDVVTPGPIAIDLAPPADHGTYVELSWTSNAELDYAVVMAEEGRAEPQVLFARRSDHYRVDVRPGLRYCFQVQGTGPRGTYESGFRSLRGAVCKR